jgi:hypothetical protein
LSVQRVLCFSAALTTVACLCVCLFSELFLWDSHYHPDSIAPVSPQPSRRSYVTLSLLLFTPLGAPVSPPALPL